MTLLHIPDTQKELCIKPHGLRLREDAWGDHVVIQAVAHMLNNTITILEHRNNYSNGYLTIIPPYGVTDGNDYDDEKALKVMKVKVMRTQENNLQMIRLIMRKLKTFLHLRKTVN